MGSLRNFVLIVFLAGVGWAVYVALHKPPKNPDRLDIAPAWNPPQVGLGLSGAPTGTVDKDKLSLPPLMASALSASGSAPAPARSTSGTTAAAPAAGSVTAPAVAAAAAPTSSPVVSVSYSGAAPASTAAVPKPADEPGFATASSVPAAAIPVIAAPTTPITPPATTPLAPPTPATPPPAIATTPPVATATPALTNPLAASVTPPAAPPTAVSAPTPSNPAASPAPVAAATPTLPAAAPAQSVAAPAPPVQSGPPRLADVLQTARTPLENGRYAEALLILTKVYRDSLTAPVFSPDESRQLVDMLDQLAGSVIYSRDHLLAPPHRVQPGESADSVARRYNISAELLAKINGLREPAQLTPGMELKVVPGPFEAVVDLNRYELILFVGDRYAGRFPVGFGQDQPLAEGQFVVREKQINPFYRGTDRIFTAGDPSNPLGRRKLDLGGVLSIHGTDNPQSVGRTEGRGAIRLGERDITDVYDILTVGSPVMLRR